MRTASFLWLLILLLAETTTVYSQGRFNARPDRPGFGYGQRPCIAVLSDLTEEQKAKMTELANSHQAAITELRIQQRSTFDIDKKIAIRQEMLKKVEVHRNDLRKILTEEQLKQHDQLLVQNYTRGRRFMNIHPGCRGQGRFGRHGFRGGW